MQEENKDNMPFILIDNNWFNRIDKESGLPIDGYINKYGYKGLFLYSIIKLNLTLNNYYVFTLKEIYNIFNLNTRTNSRNINGIKELLQSMQQDKIIQCYNNKNEFVDFMKVKNGDLIYHTFDRPATFTKIYIWELQEILKIQSSNIDMTMLFTMFTFIIKSLNSKTGYYSMDDNYIMNCTGIKSEVTIIKYKKILIANKLIAVDNVGLLFDGFMPNGASYKQFTDAYARYIDKIKLEEYIKAYRKSQRDTYIKYGKHQLANESRSLKMKLRWLNKYFAMGTINADKYLVQKENLLQHINKIKGERKNYKAV